MPKRRFIGLHCLLLTLIVFMVYQTMTLTLSSLMGDEERRVKEGIEKRNHYASASTSTTNVLSSCRLHPAWGSEDDKQEGVGSDPQRLESRL